MAFHLISVLFDWLFDGWTLHSEHYIIVQFMGTFCILTTSAIPASRKESQEGVKSWMQDEQKSLLRFYEKIGDMVMLPLPHIHKQ